MLLMYRTSYTSWQLKYTFLLCRYRKQFCQQRHSLRTWSGTLNISCTNMFFFIQKQQSPASDRLPLVPMLFGTWAAGPWVLLRRRRRAPPWSGCSGTLHRAGRFKLLGCSSLYLFSQRLFIHVTTSGQVILCAGSGHLYTKGVTRMQEGHI